MVMANTSGSGTDNTAAKIHNDFRFGSRPLPTVRSRWISIWRTASWWRTAPATSRQNRNRSSDRTGIATITPASKATATTSTVRM
jgi:hypothetical protein